MKKRTYCEFCKKNIGYKGHLVLLSLLHLEIENFPESDFEDDTLYEKAHALSHAVSKKNIHLNLSYAATQLLLRTKEMAKKV